MLAKDAAPWVGEFQFTPQGPAPSPYQGKVPFGGTYGDAIPYRPRPPADPYADVRELMAQYPGVDPNELRRFRDQQRQAERDDAANRFRQDSAAVAPEYERRRQAANQASAEAMARSQRPGYGTTRQGGMAGDMASWGSREAAQSALGGGGVVQFGPGSWGGAGGERPAPFRPGMAQPIQTQSYGTPYGAPSPWSDSVSAEFGPPQYSAPPAAKPPGGGKPPNYQTGPQGHKWF